MKNVRTEKRPALRMAPEHLFHFHCSPGIPCFTQCCQDVTIVLTPYDIVRMKNRLRMSSDRFLETHTLVLPVEKRILPMVVLRMKDGAKRCPFVTEKGCSIYEDRPWPCRMFPLNTEGDGAYNVVLQSDLCQGLKREESWKIEDWLKSQAIPPYDEMNELLSSVTIPLQVHEAEIENPQIAKMVFMSLYNLDKFRDFVFQSSFLDRFEVEDPERIERARSDDVELLKFAIDWIKFGIFGEKLFWVKETGRAKK